MPSTHPIPQIAALRRSRDALASVVSALTGEDLRRRSGSRAWDVSQVLSHLGSGAEISLANLDANLTGSDLPPRESMVAVWDRWNAMSPEMRVEEFNRWDERHVAALESIPPESAASLQIRLAFLPVAVDLGSAAGFRLSEHVLHSWDVEIAFRSDAALPGDASALILKQTPMLVGHLGHADAWAGPQVTLAIRATDPEQHLWLGLGTAVTLEREPRPHDGTLSLPAESLVRLTAGRLAAEQTPASVRIDGPVTLDDLRAVFPGF